MVEMTIIIIVIDLFFSLNIIRMIKSRRIRWAGHVACMGERRGAYMILVGIPEGRRPLGRRRRRCGDNIKMDLQEVGMAGGMDSIDLAFVNAVMNLQVP